MVRASGLWADIPWALWLSDLLLPMRALPHWAPFAPFG